ncbi:MAG: hypothetical protein ABH842_03725 [Candidatus Micrarchaeota archaeon]
MVILRCRADQVGTGALSTVYYKSHGTRVVALFRRYHGNGGRWDGLLQLGPGGIARNGETPRATLCREFPEELPQLTRFMETGKVKIYGFDNDGVLGIPAFVTANPRRPPFNVHMFLVEISPEAAAVLSSGIPSDLAVLANRMVSSLSNYRAMETEWTLSVINSIKLLFEIIPPASEELSFPLFVPTDLVSLMIKYSPGSFMPHYSASCQHETNYDLLMKTK